MIALSQYHTFVFDLDGTLVDSVPDLTLALNAALNQSHLPQVNALQVRTWVGNGSAKLVERAVQSIQPDMPASQISALHKQFLQCYSGVLCKESQLYPGVESLLEMLKQQDKQLALLTNKPVQFLPELLQHLGIDHYFAMVLGGDSLPEKKPSPMPLQHILQQLSVPAESCLMVGDSRSDILCAQQAGVDCAALLQGYHQGVDLSALKPAYVFNDVVGLLQGLGSN